MSCFHTFEMPITFDRSIILLPYSIGVQAFGRAERAARAELEPTKEQSRGKYGTDPVVPHPIL